MHLNDEQMKVIESKNRFLFLLAGAGSGKTRVIVEKIKKLIEESVLPQDILAITFTKKAAKEMIERVNHEDVDIHTFHRFCLIQLKAHSTYTYKIIDEANLPFTKDDLLKITRYKNSIYRTTKPKVYEKYQMYLTNHHMKDFDDLLLDFIELIINKSCVKTYKHIFIDEFQDTNLLQYEVLKHLIKHDTHVLAVGDPDQSIYQFRGAHAKIITSFVNDYQALIFTLTKNYRSSKEIIEISNQLIKKNNRKYKKQLEPINYSIKTPNVFEFDNETCEAIHIIKLIKSLTQNKIKHQEIAILYRNHSRAYEMKYQMDMIDFPYVKENQFVYHQGVHLMTIHQAKGLEFDVVFIVGLEHKVLPSTHHHTQSEQDEERRLMFVAMTRAKKYLYLSYVKCNSFHVIQKPSLFIKECGLKRQKIK